MSAPHEEPSGFLPTHVVPLQYAVATHWMSIVQVVGHVSGFCVGVALQLWGASGVQSIEMLAPQAVSSSTRSFAQVFKAVQLRSSR